MRFKIFIQQLVDEKSSPCCQMPAMNQAAPGSVSICVVNVRSQSEIKAKLQGRADSRELGGEMVLWPHIHCEPLPEANPETCSIWFSP